MNFNDQKNFLDHLIPTFAHLNDDDFISRMKNIFESREINICVQKELLDQLILTFAQLNDDDFISRIKNIFESRKINICVQKELFDQLIPTFNQLDNDDFNSKIRKIVESRKINTYIQRKRNDIFICLCNLPDQQVCDALNLLQTMTYPRGNHKREIISIYLQKKVREFLDTTKQIRPAQFQRAASKLFKSNNKEYNANFVKLAADISNIGQTSIHATNNEIAAITSNQNSPKETSSRFFGYGIMANKSTRGKKKVLIICFSYWNNIKEKPIITVAKVTDITHCNAETISTTQLPNHFEYLVDYTQPILL
ncbi:8367_t:CDS:2 [Racocetra persica]|uniref:8367_t:CDS:1 n=1 Tax=Racocetra persica TaxID=160502 RepID=A0ACA9NNV8_9GLOM|nr:8367_t:CDS:2 [Racocetra persica]